MVLKRNQQASLAALCQRRDDQPWTIAQVLEPISATDVEHLELDLQLVCLENGLGSISEAEVGRLPNDVQQPLQLEFELDLPKEFIFGLYLLLHQVRHDISEVHIASQEGHSGLSHMPCQLLSDHLSQLEDNLDDFLLQSLHLPGSGSVLVHSESLPHSEELLQLCSLWLHLFVFGDSAVDLFDVSPLLLPAFLFIII